MGFCYIGQQNTRICAKLHMNVTFSSVFTVVKNLVVLSGLLIY